MALRHFVREMRYTVWWGGVGGLQGTLAEYIVVNADLLAVKPKSLSMHEAAALPLVTITAWEGIIDHAQVHSGQTVLVHAGAGAVGHVAVQLAKARGAYVFTTVSPDKREIAERFGATAIDYRALTPSLPHSRRVRRAPYRRRRLRCGL